MSTYYDRNQGKVIADGFWQQNNDNNKHNTGGVKKTVVIQMLTVW